MKTNDLPLVYPLILYNGKKPYSYSMDLFDLFPQDERELAKKTLTSPYHLIDLTQVSDEELQKYLWFGTLALTLKHIHDADILPFLQDIIVSVKELEKHGEESYIYSIVTYIAEAGNIPHQNDWAETIQKLEEQDQEKVMKLIRLVEQVIVHRNPLLAQKIIDIGIEQGIEQGEHKRELEIAKALLLQGVALDTIAAATNLPKEKIKKMLS
jgi:predicted transposase/invertase (TIGR01784 family)